MAILRRIIINLISIGGIGLTLLENINSSVSMDSKYPIGKWICPSVISKNLLEQWIGEIEALPTQLYGILDDCQLKEENTYRNDGWNVRQIIHHIADSHINAYIRHKLAYTTDNPVINPYPEEKWAMLQDVISVELKVSVQLIEALHRRWVEFLKSLGKEDFKKSFFHPQSNRIILLEESIGMYAWHGRHHLTHLKIALGIDIND